jgi:CBS domain-containing protein
MRVAEICTRSVVCVPLPSTVRDAAEIMRERHVGSVVVVDRCDAGQEPVGILTDRDIVISVVAPGVLPEVMTVCDVMSRPLYTCDENEDLLTAIRTMREKGVRRLVVTNRVGGLVGILSVDDAYHALGTQLRELDRAVEREQIREVALRS